MSQSTVDAGLENLRRLQEQGPRPSIRDGRHAGKERRVRDYLMTWYTEETPEDFDIDWNPVEIVVSARLKKSWGRAKYWEDKDRYEIVISANAIENHGWEEVKETIRHEAIHIWQYQTLGFGGHGVRFRKWADKFGCTVYADCRAQEAKYKLYCDQCGSLVSQSSRRSKTVKNSHLYRSNCCSATIEVVVNDRDR